MSKLLVLIVFCGMCISVFSDDEAKDCIFDWESFSPQTGSLDMVIDYSGQQISTLEEDDKTYHYITGPLKINSALNNSYDVFCIIQKVSGQDVENIVVDYREACYFSENTYPDYLLPIAGKHNDFPPQGNVCPIQEGSFNIDSVKSSQELVSPSKLDKGKYYVQVVFYQNRPVGGFSGNFTVLRD